MLIFTGKLHSETLKLSKPVEVIEYILNKTDLNESKYYNIISVILAIIFVFLNIFTISHGEICERIQAMFRFLKFFII